MEYYLAKKKNGLFVLITMNYKIIMLSERVRQKRMCNVYYHLCRILEHAS